MWCGLSPYVGFERVGVVQMLFLQVYGAAVLLLREAPSVGWAVEAALPVARVV
jgi:hypothetical protein